MIQLAKSNLTRELLVVLAAAADAAAAVVVVQTTQIDGSATAKWTNKKKNGMRDIWTINACGCVEWIRLIDDGRASRMRSPIDAPCIRSMRRRNRKWTKSHAHTESVYFSSCTLFTILWLFAYFNNGIVKTRISAKSHYIHFLYVFFSHFTSWVKLVPLMANAHTYTIYVIAKIAIKQNEYEDIRFSSTRKGGNKTYKIHIDAWWIRPDFIFFLFFFSSEIHWVFGWF